MEVFTDSRTANRQKALSVLAVAERHIRRFQPRSARIGAAQRLRSRPLTASPPHGSLLPVRFEALRSRASLASPFRSARPAVPHGVREKRARGGRSAARSPRRASTAHGWGGSRYPVWVDEKGPARSRRARRDYRERLDPGERRSREPRAVAERATIRGGAQRSREYPDQRPRACRGLSRRWRRRPTPRR